VKFSETACIVYF